MEGNRAEEPEVLQARPGGKSYRTLAAHEQCNVFEQFASESSI